MAEEPELEEYEELEEEQPAGDDAAANKGYVGIHSVSFDDMQLKRELLRAIQDAGFEHPSESAGSVEIPLLCCQFRRCFCLCSGRLAEPRMHIQFSSNASLLRFKAKM